MRNHHIDDDLNFEYDLNTRIFCTDATGVIIHRQFIRFRNMYVIQWMDRFDESKTVKYELMTEGEILERFKDSIYQKYKVNAHLPEELFDV